METGCLLPCHRENFSDSLRKVVAVHDALKFGFALGLPD
jgi:hypothetical protein